MGSHGKVAQVHNSLGLMLLHHMALVVSRVDNALKVSLAEISKVLSCDDGVSRLDGNLNVLHVELKN